MSDLAELGERITQRRVAANHELQFGVRCSKLSHQGADMCHDSRYFSHIGLGEHHSDVDACCAPVTVGQAIDDEGLGKSNRLDPGECFRTEFGIGINQLLHDQVVAIGLAVLIVGQRVDTGRERGLPSSLGKRRHCRQGLGGKQVSFPRLYRDQQIIVLGIDVLQCLERRELRVLLAEENAVISRERKKSPTACQQNGDNDRQASDQPAAAHDPLPIGDDIIVVDYLPPRQPTFAISRLSSPESL